MNLHNTTYLGQKSQAFHLLADGCIGNMASWAGISQQQGIYKQRGILRLQSRAKARNLRVYLIFYCSLNRSPRSLRQEYTMLILPQYIPVLLTRFCLYSHYPVRNSGCEFFLSRSMEFSDCWQLAQGTKPVFCHCRPTLVVRAVHLRGLKHLLGALCHQPLHSSYCSHLIYSGSPFLRYLRVINIFGTKHLDQIRLYLKIKLQNQSYYSFHFSVFHNKRKLWN